MKSIILLGAPGSGKGTLATKVRKKWNVPHISTGDIFRSAVKKSSSLGEKAHEYMKKGLLVPDDITNEVIRERFSSDDVKKGFILDGYPRTIVQARSLDKVLLDINKKLDAVILLDIEEELVVRRITGRRICSKCEIIYHIDSMPPALENLCDKCGGELIQRKDDNEIVVRERLETYKKQTAPLVDFYEKKGLLLKIDASKKPSFMLEQLEALSF